MKLLSLQALLVSQLKDLYSAESQLVKALPKMAKHASSASLKQAIESHLEETKRQVERLQQISQIMNCKLTGQKCKAMEELIDEGGDIIKANGDKTVIDAGIVAAAQRVEHYEMAGYGPARAMAEQLGQNNVAQLLQETLQEERAADQKLSQVVESDIYPQVRHMQQVSGSHDESAKQPERTSVPQETEELHHAGQP